MKRVFLFLSLVFGIGAMYGQEIIQLDEARLIYNPDAIEVNSDLGTVKCIVKENYIGEFSKNPIQFMKQNFDFKQFLSSVLDTKEFDEFVVTFNSKKGYLEAIYTNEGDLVQTLQRFNDKILPLDLRKQVYSSNQGWTMVSNKYIASGKKDRIDKEYYRIKLENGSKSKSIKLVPGATTIVGVVSN